MTVPVGVMRPILLPVLGKPEVAIRPGGNPKAGYRSDEAGSRKFGDLTSRGVGVLFDSSLCWRRVARAG